MSLPVFLYSFLNIFVSLYKTHLIWKHTYVENIFATNQNEGKYFWIALLWHGTELLDPWTRSLIKIGLTLLQRHSFITSFSGALLEGGARVLCWSLTFCSMLQGDDGGPVVFLDTTGDYIIVGIVSFGSKSGCQFGNPVAFTRVTSFLTWIQPYAAWLTSDVT